MKKLVILIEDDDDLRGVLRDLLVDAGHEVSAHRDAERALGQLRELHLAPALLMVDLALPGMSGWELLVILRMTSHRLGKVPVLMMSGKELEPELHHAIDAFLLKPLHFANVLSVVSKLLATPL